MMKSFLSLIFLIICFSEGKGQSPDGRILPFDVRQYSTLDTANYRIDYKTTCTLDPKKGVVVTNDMYLLVGRKMSKFGQIAVLDRQAEIIEEHKREIVRGIDARGLAGIEVYKYLHGDKPHCELTLKLFIYEWMYTFTYQDELHTQNWTLGRERKDILGYACQIARAKFRGRDYTAWVATDIPISNGPWLLGGLPGLILEAYDTNKEYHFQATDIICLKQTLPIVKYKARYKKTTRQQANELCKRLHANMPQTIQATFPKVRFDVKRTSYPHNPIEQE